MMQDNGLRGVNLIHLLQTILNQYFQQLWIKDIDFLLTVGRRVTDSTNKELIQEFEVKEIHKALKQMHPTKAFEPNGMSLVFFQKRWHIVGLSLTKALLHVLNLGQIPFELNRTLITLIPKKKQPINLLIIVLLVYVIFFII